MTTRDARKATQGVWRRRAATALFLAPTSAWYFLLLIVPLGILLVFSVGERAPEGGYAHPD